MKCVCDKKCQTVIDGLVHFCSKGRVEDFDECPSNWTPLEGPKAKAVDFGTASEDELMETKWKYSDAKAFVKDTYNVTLKKHRDTTKKQLVEMILDARYRAVS